MDVKGLFTVKLKSVVEWETHPEKVRVITQLQDSSVLSGCNAGIVKHWSVDGSVLFKTIEAHTSIVEALVQIDSKTFASCSIDETIKLWDIDSGKCLRQWTEDYFVQALLKPRDQNTLLSSGSREYMHLWCLDTGALLQTLRCGCWITSLLELQNGLVLAASNTDGMQLWNLQTMQLVKSVGEANARVRHVVQLYDGVVVSTCDNIINYWNEDLSMIVRSFSEHTNEITKMIQLKDSDLLCSVGKDQTICLWNTQTGVCVSCIIVDESIFCVQQLEGDSEHFSLAVGLKSGNIQILTYTRKTLVELCCRSIVQREDFEEVKALLPTELQETCFQIQVVATRLKAFQILTMMKMTLQSCCNLDQ
eukprot:TRINITY_DN3253_c0_g1_i1.p1 TRINITY_DN3253_c0_g1~~TRINITY_DN3253_c0_g1_i1.p1  ORF type:complete len:363 (+),score=59.12 TRINITY_DN3253_c0_g1_i1:139-1227(+)